MKHTSELSLMGCYGKQEHDDDDDHDDFFFDFLVYFSLIPSNKIIRGEEINTQTNPAINHQVQILYN